MGYKLNPFSGMFDVVNEQSPGSSSNWQAPVANKSLLPMVGNAAGDARIALDTATGYIWSGSEWRVISGDTKTQKITLTGTDITNKYVTLTESPLTPSLTRLIVIGGIEQKYSTDFTVSTNQLNWNGLTLDGVLESGDELIIVYDI